ncbi:hypothetical protein [Legionella feeleii]|uniref:Adenosine deaminase n=1 Tax=Legionella feeleii TaxID=453 RepID=A0A378IUH6_9GAMM|nr:hypothetical protein [Legionella feeleii]STX38693.1 adenosine deaminase [Legionella feeleii]
MFEQNTSDLHCHLNGSFSLPYLYEVAKKNGCLDKYMRLVALRDAYLNKTQKQPEEGYAKEDINSIWEIFALIQAIIQTPEDISLGTLDVIRSSAAKYMEIRTTPKEMTDKSKDDYIDAFEQGLLAATQSTSKKAFGLLSLDRTVHSFSEAQHFIKRVVQSPEGVLKGIDISGNPIAPRTLRGKELEQLIELALNSKVGLAIHMGEADTAVEREDTDTILSALEAWVKTNAPQQANPLFGKVRLGHCIFLTLEQKNRIRALNIPIEVCPTCHSKLNWHKEKSPHPVTGVYSDVEQPVTFATDDEFVFGAGIKTEYLKGLGLFSNKNELSKKQIKENQAQFRFA